MSVRSLDGARGATGGAPHPFTHLPHSYVPGRLTQKDLAWQSFVSSFAHSSISTQMSTRVTLLSPARTIWKPGLQPVQFLPMHRSYVVLRTVQMSAQYPSVPSRRSTGRVRALSVCIYHEELQRRSGMSGSRGRAVES